MLDAARSKACRGDCFCQSSLSTCGVAKRVCTNCHPEHPEPALIRLFLICRTARLARDSLRSSPSDDAVICPACWRGRFTAGHDDIRDLDRLITLTRSAAH